MRDNSTPQALLDAIDDCGVLDHFHWFVTAHMWTSTLTDTGSVVAYTTEPGGIVAITPSDGSVADNDQAYLGWTNKNLTLAADQPCKMVAKFKYAEGATDDLNVVVGLCSTYAAETLVDNGAGMVADYTGAVLFKVDGDTLWQAQVSKSTTIRETKRITADLRTNLTGQDVVAGSTSWQTLEIEINPKGSLVKCTVTFVLNGTPIAKFEDIDYSSAAAMSPIFGLKNGAATTVETLYVDFCYAGQTLLRQ